MDNAWPDTETIPEWSKSKSMNLYGNNPYIYLIRKILRQMSTKQMTRFDTRISIEQKAYLEKAARLGGYKTLSEFILSSAKNTADQIIEKNDLILATEKDREVFFHALLHPAKPNARLKKAAHRYKERLKK
jgi:uncharacterized protein (DUF1778 family)